MAGASKGTADATTAKAQFRLGRAHLGVQAVRAKRMRLAAAEFRHEGSLNEAEMLRVRKMVASDLAVAVLQLRAALELSPVSSSAMVHAKLKEGLRLQAELSKQGAPPPSDEEAMKSYRERYEELLSYLPPGSDAAERVNQWKGYAVVAPPAVAELADNWRAGNQLAKMAPVGAPMQMLVNSSARVD